LLLIGQNLPHYGFANRLTKRNVEAVLQFSPDFLGDTTRIPELKAIGELMSRSKYGISFRGSTKKKVGALLDKMSIQGAFERMLTTIEILHLMATSKEYSLLNVSEIAITASKQDMDRIREVYDHVRANFQEDIPISEVAKLISMTEPSFCRYFKKQTGNTFTQFVNEFRVIHACKLLSETSRTIADICYECGFNNFSHFNKKFKTITAKSPREYRDEFKQVIVAS
jgi:AraC-like DNA-binding protein